MNALFSIVLLKINLLTYLHCTLPVKLFNYLNVVYSLLYCLLYTQMNYDHVSEIVI